MERSLIEIARDYLKTQKEAKSMDDIMNYVFSNVKIPKDELLKEQSKFYTEFTLCNDFVYCGKNMFDLKERQDEALYDCDSSFFIDVKERKRKLNARKKKVADEIDDEPDSIENYDGEVDEDDLSIDDIEDDDLDFDDIDSEDEEDDDDEDESFDADFSEYDDDDLYEN